jgi:hypothetical protein
MARSRTCRLLPLLAVFFMTGCGGGSDDPGTPTSPSPPPPPASGVAVIAGEWSATSDFQQNGVRYISNMTASVVQTDRNVEGTFRFTSPGFTDWRGRFSGTLAGTSPDTQFVGNVTVEADSATGTGICTANVTMAGRSVSNSMRWEAPSFTMTSNVPTQPPHACRGQLFTPLWIFFR